MMRTAIDYYDQARDLTVAVLQQDDGVWRVTAFMDLDEVLPPFELSPYQPATAFAKALERVNERLRDQGGDGLVRDADGAVLGIDGRQLAAELGASPEAIAAVDLAVEFRSPDAKAVRR